MTLLSQATRLLQTIKPSKGYVDLSDKKWLHPLEILPLAALIQKEGLQYKPPQVEDCRTYLEYFEFPEGLSKYSKKSDKYIPIYNFTVSSRNVNAVRVRSEIINNLIEVFLKHIGVHNGIRDGLYLSINEIIDNIEEHSNSQRGWIQAQYYPIKGHLDICIVDTGVSISGSYAKNKIAVESEVRAIQKALEGVSVKKEKLRGAGIRTFINMVVNGFGGEAVLVSGGALAYATKKGVVPYRTYRRWNGTIIGLRIPKQEGSIEYSKFIK